MASLPIVDHEAGRIQDGLDKTIEALARAKLGLVQWADGLHQIQCLEKDQPGPVRRSKGSLILIPVTPQLLIELATRAAVHRKWDRRASDYRPTNCPMSIAAGIMARGYWPEFPALTGIVQAATLDLDGREISRPGLDGRTGLYIATASMLPPTRGVLGRARGQKGIATLTNLLRGFRFVSLEDRSAALAAIMTALLRRLLPSAPMFALTAPTPGTGKTLLAEIISIIATGQRPAVMSLGADENEFAKRVAGVLLAGDSLLLIDNVTRPMGNEDVLNQMLSQPVMRFRPLGGSGMVSAPTNLLVLVTGNNLAIVGDAKRRTVLIRMDAGMERPEEREFDFDVLAEARARRDDLIRAALDISHCYIEAGCPAVDAKAYGSFGDWDRMVRRALIWFGEPDPLRAAAELREHDPDVECMRAMFSAWVQVYGQQAKTASDVVNDGLHYGISQHVNQELHDALQLACNGKIDARRLGGWLRSHRDRIVDGHQLTQAGRDGHAKVTRWQVTQL